MMIFQLIGIGFLKYPKVMWYNGGRLFNEMTDEMYVWVDVCVCVCKCMFRQIFVPLDFSASKDGSVIIFFLLFLHQQFISTFFLFYFQDLIYQSSLVRGNRKINSSRIVLPFLVDLSFVCFA